MHLHPIAITSNKQFTHHWQFKKYLINLCHEKRQKGIALSFAFILFDFEDYNIIKILKDHNYWVTLDKISGQYFTVFYIDTQYSYFLEKQKELYENSRKGYAAYLQPIESKQTPLDRTIEFLQKELQLNETVKHPFILFFQVEKFKIIDFFLVQLKQEKLEESFLELKNQLEYAADSIKKVTPEHYENYQEIFNLIKNGVQNGRINHFINKNIVRKIGFKTILSFIKILSGTF